MILPYAVEVVLASTLNRNVLGPGRIDSLPVPLGRLFIGKGSTVRLNQTKGAHVKSHRGAFVEPLFYNIEL